MVALLACLLVFLLDAEVDVDGTPEARSGFFVGSFGLTPWHHGMTSEVVNINE